MIGRADIVQRVAEWGLREEVVEKDYVLGWLLAGIGAHPLLSTKWVFKGGTCLKKCYIETYRFSEDLDFTVVANGPLVPDDLTPLVTDMLTAVGQASGIDFADTPPRFRLRPSGLSTEGRIYYRGPRQARGVGSIKLDLTSDETVARPPVLRNIAHPYPDDLAPVQRVSCYSFEEVFAEKIRAMGQRGRPRDLYDIVNLFRRPDLRTHPELIREVLADKCASKGIDVPTYETVTTGDKLAQLRADWENMLQYQLPVLPPLDQFLEELPQLFAWLDGAEVATPASFPASATEESAWSPPPTIAVWGTGAPLEVIRFAAANHLLVELGYHGRTRLIEPYSLRRTRTGNVLLHAERADGSGHRTYDINQIVSARATTQPFHPRWAIEFTSAGPLSAPPAASVIRRASRPSPRSNRGTGPTYVVECPVCRKRFRRKRRDLVLRPHKSPDGWNCSGRRGYLADTLY